MLNTKAITRQVSEGPPHQRPFLQELNERLINLDQHLQDTVNMSSDMNAQLFGPLPCAGEIIDKPDAANHGITSLVFERLTRVEQIAFHLRNHIEQTRKIL